MAKVTLIIVGVLVVGILLFASPFVYLGLRSASQQRALKNRTDFPQIAGACVALARANTNTGFIYPNNPVVPPLLRALAPQYITARSNCVTMEFHGGFDHYGYRVRQSETNSNLWTISWYTEQGERLLKTIQND